MQNTKVNVGNQFQSSTIKPVNKAYMRIFSKHGSTKDIKNDYIASQIGNKKVVTFYSKI